LGAAPQTFLTRSKIKRKSGSEAIPDCAEAASCEREEEVLKGFSVMEIGNHKERLRVREAGASAAGRGQRPYARFPGKFPSAGFGAAPQTFLTRSEIKRKSGSEAIPDSAEAASCEREEVLKGFSVMEIGKRKESLHVREAGASAAGRGQRPYARFPDEDRIKRTQI